MTFPNFFLLVHGGVKLREFLILGFQVLCVGENMVLKRILEGGLVD